MNFTLSPHSRGLLLDMVHHNPGDAPFVTRFNDARELAKLGYDVQVVKGLIFALSFEKIHPGLFPALQEEREWVTNLAASKEAEIDAASKAGLKIVYHTDLFVLPKRVREHFAAEICDAQGRIDLTRPKTMVLYRQIFAELFRQFPGIAGLMIRVGEVYLFDAPYHCGNTAVPLNDPTIDRKAQVKRFSALINFLREEICIGAQRGLIYRTWDYFADRFHADADFYLEVTNAVAPHPNLIFSIKHTGSDFFRASHANRCLGQGSHRQIVEVQCQREYEGKGAVPCYIARGVINGFPEHVPSLGLDHWRKSPLYAGLFTWTRGGGWFGPYLRDEFWPELNARVLASWHAKPDLSEEWHFERICRGHFGVNAKSAEALREMAVASEEIILHGRYCLAAAEIEGFRYEATNLWMRDDCLGGIDQLADTFAALERHSRLDEALAEKKYAAALAAKLPMIAEKIAFADPARTAFVRWSALYAARLFDWTAEGWTLMALRWRNGRYGREDNSPDLQAYDQKRAAALALTRDVNSWATGFTGDYWNWPGAPRPAGMDQSVRQKWTPAKAIREEWQPQLANE